MVPRMFQAMSAGLEFANGVPGHGESLGHRVRSHNL
jgi:hypothetical protein